MPWLAMQIASATDLIRTSTQVVCLMSPAAAMAVAAAPTYVQPNLAMMARPGLAHQMAREVSRPEVSRVKTWLRTHWSEAFYLVNVTMNFVPLV